MALNAVILAAARAGIAGTAELAAHRAAAAAFIEADVANAPAKWAAAFGDNQPGGSTARRLAEAVREQVRAATTSSMNPGDAEESYRQLDAEFVMRCDPPPSDAERQTFVAALAAASQD